MTPTVGLEVDTSSRNAVIAFYNEYYTSSENADQVMGWTGDYGTCDPGFTSLEYVEMIERRINFYRAMAGVSANTLVNSGSTVLIEPSDPEQPPAFVTKHEAAQRAAKMFAWSNTLTHNPTGGTCFSAASWNGAYRSNLAIGFHGPAAIDAYMRENDPVNLSIWDANVGHRRWLLRQGSTDFASGDIPGNGTQFRSVNVTYVVQKPGENVHVAPQFVAWPSPGYFPDEFIPKQWSVTHPTAYFNNATVTMTGPGGVNIPVTIVDRTTRNLGSPAILWSVPDSVASIHVDEDTTYNITVSGIDDGGQIVQHSYEVTVMDPDDLQEPLGLVGTQSPPVSGANYFFDPVDGVDADGYSLIVSETEDADWVAGAEVGESGYIIDETDPARDLFVSGPYVRSGSRSFRLVLPAPPGPGVQQRFTIDREVIPGAGGELRYHLMKQYLGAGERLDVETSLDNGETWQISQSHTAAQIPASWGLRTLSLAEGQPVRVRFVLRWVSGWIYDPGSNLVGCFIDDISFGNCDWIIAESEIEIPSGQNHVRLDSTSLGLIP